MFPGGMIIESVALNVAEWYAEIELIWFWQLIKYLSEKSVREDSATGDVERVQDLGGCEVKGKRKWTLKCMLPF